LFGPHAKLDFIAAAGAAPVPTMADIKKGREIPYEDLAADMFPESVLEGQKFVPFLGAGVSISGRAFKPQLTLKAAPKRSDMDQALATLNLTGRARTFAEVAILLAFLVQAAETEEVVEKPNALLDRLKKEDFPPSAGELTELLRQRSHYSTFLRIAEGLRALFPADAITTTEDDQEQMLQLLAKISGIANPPEALTSIASYFESLEGRKDLWELMREVMATKKTPTRTHKLLAEATRFHLSDKVASDYLIITTNYDCLMENALDALSVPYVVLTTRKGDPKVLIRCSQNVKDRDVLRNRYWNKLYPSGFVLSKAQSLVILYKIHGCLHQDLAFEDEGLVISDNDYVDYVSQMSKIGIIPATVSELMRDKPLWFLGYSLSDWNVRSIYEAVKQKSDPDRKNIKDFSVMHSVGDFEKLFFEKNRITIFQASLNEFVDGIVAGLRTGVTIGAI
jgi:SIR2-like domain